MLLLGLLLLVVLGGHLLTATLEVVVPGYHGLLLGHCIHL